MTRLRRAPHCRLRPFVKALWAIDERGTEVPPHQEHVVPTGDMHLVFRLSGEPLRLIDVTGVAHTLGCAVIGGVRERFYAREVAGPTRSVGVQLHPFAAAALLGAPAQAFAGRHVRVDELWGRDASTVHERLSDAAGPSAQLAILEETLGQRLDERCRVHPAVSIALAGLRGGRSIADIVRSTGYSHRAVATLFHRVMGTTPKKYARLLRLQRVLRLATRDARPWAEVAELAGYSDQPHFTREFREFTGVTPEQYRRARPTAAHHVAVARGAR
jgi:AraC-like DNA-binding protein